MHWNHSGERALDEQDYTRKTRSFFDVSIKKKNKDKHPVPSVGKRLISPITFFILSFLRNGSQYIIEVSTKEYFAENSM
ncbi:MAG TPA: hypothetical protein DD412_02145 [Holosporales bacterium]|nr:hypothetical protein [Holosporales bacterium]